MGEEVLGTAAKIEVTKDNCTIVGDGSSEESVKSRVKQIRNLLENTEQDYEKEKLNERIARLSGGVAIIQVSKSPIPLSHQPFCLVCPAPMLVVQFFFVDQPMFYGCQRLTGYSSCVCPSLR